MATGGGALRQAAAWPRLSVPTLRFRAVSGTLRGEASGNGICLLRQLLRRTKRRGPGERCGEHQAPPDPGSRIPNKGVWALRARAAAGGTSLDRAGPGALSCGAWASLVCLLSTQPSGCSDSSRCPQGDTEGRTGSPTCPRTRRRGAELGLKPGLVQLQGLGVNPRAALRTVPSEAGELSNGSSAPRETFW